MARGQRGGSKGAYEKVSSRCKRLAADRTQSVPVSADVYMLKHVLHGRRCAILNNCCAALIPVDGRLLVIKFILPPPISQADPQLESHLMSDLNKLAVTGAHDHPYRERKVERR